MLNIRSFVCNAFQENTIVVSDKTRRAVIIDPGCYEREEQDEMDDYIAAENLDVQYILNTHCHIDHVLGNYRSKQKYTVPLMIHPLEEYVLGAVKSYAPNYGFAAYQETTADKFVEEGDTVEFGSVKMKVLFIPGHSPGSVGFYCEDQKTIFSGDVLFHRSIGRTDLPGGNFDTLIKSIHQKLFTLPDDVVVYPGHGPITTIGEEKVSNPFCALSLTKG